MQDEQSLLVGAQERGAFLVAAELEPHAVAPEVQRASSIGDLEMDGPEGQDLGGRRRRSCGHTVNNTQRLASVYDGQRDTTRSETP